jgi:hypothetical protein
MVPVPGTDTVPVPGIDTVPAPSTLTEQNRTEYQYWQTRSMLDRIRIRVHRINQRFCSTVQLVITLVMYFFHTNEYRSFYLRDA